MSERPQAPDPQDLLAMWRHLYDANEKVWSQASSEFMETPAFAQWQGRMLETFLGFQKAIKESTTAQLQAANIPTRDDIARLGELILSLEEKVDRLADRLPPEASRQAPPRASRRASRTVPPRRAPAKKPGRSRAR